MLSVRPSRYIGLLALCLLPVAGFTQGLGPPEGTLLVFAFIAASYLIFVVLPIAFLIIAYRKSRTATLSVPKTLLFTVPAFYVGTSNVFAVFAFQFSAGVLIWGVFCLAAATFVYKQCRKNSVVVESDQTTVE